MHVHNFVTIYLTDVEIFLLVLDGPFEGSTKSVGSILWGT